MSPKNKITRTLLIISFAIVVNLNVSTDPRGFHRLADSDKNGSAIYDIGAYEYYPDSLFLPLITK